MAKRVKTNFEDRLQNAFQDVQIIAIKNDDAGKHRREAINRLADMVRQYFNDGIMKHTIEAMAEKPLLGEPAGNCHNVALAFVTDLIIAKRAQGWFWVNGGNASIKNDLGGSWKHSWLEYDDFAVDATIKQTANPNQLTVTVGEVSLYYKARRIVKIFERRNAAQTRRWIFKQAKDEI